jgi:asparagine synthase (glutamine-hydrolysing)
VVTADVRLDNRNELINLLGFDRGNSHQITDSELILAAYEKWGESCPERLLGDFAFAVWDGRRQVLFCVRDHFGVKPFCYYYQPGKVFIFASQVRALIALKEVPRRINEERIADYLVPELEGIDFTSTFYQQILRHPPAHTLIVGAESFCSRRYWSLDPTREILYSSPEKNRDIFLEIFTESVNCRLRCASGAGVMMSGGMDSTSIAGVARKLNAEKKDQPLRTFSAVSNDGNDRETRNIQAMLEMDGLLGSTVQPDQISQYQSDYDEFLELTDDFFDIHIFNVPLILYIIASKHGSKVVLDGLPGDNVLSLSKSYITVLLRDRKWRDWYLEAAGLSRIFKPHYPIWKTLINSARSVFGPAWTRKMRRRLFPRYRLDKIVASSIINRDFARRIEVNRRVERLYTELRPVIPKTIKEEHANHLKAPYITVALERYDRVAAMHSIEVRHPFHDKRLVELCLAFPWQTKNYRGWNKVILRDAMAGLLPEQVISSPYCQHLGTQFSRAWFLSRKAYIEDIVQNQLEEIREYVDTSLVRQLYERCLMDWTSKDWSKVRSAAFLAKWLQRG